MELIQILSNALLDIVRKEVLPEGKTCRTATGFVNFKELGKTTSDATAADNDAAYRKQMRIILDLHCREERDCKVNVKNQTKLAGFADLCYNTQC